MTTATKVDERRAIVASQPGVADAARELPANASAPDRVVAAILAAAALSPSVLFGPVQILLGGGGFGVQAIDGRVRQPGRNAPRPRGFLERDEVPDAAWVAVPALPAALAATVALVRTSTLSRLAAPAIELAKERSEERAKLLRAIGRRGGGALAERGVADELIAAFGRMAGGILTIEDLAAPEVSVLPAKARVPWLDDLRDAGAARQAKTTVHVVAAGDARGRFVVACYEDAREGITFEPLDLVVPRLAEPVRRGEVRVRPGAARPALAPIGLASAGGTIIAAIGKPLADRTTDDLDAILAKVAETAWTAPRGIVGVIRTRIGARPI
jgi:hypothetical protein